MIEDFVRKLSKTKVAKDAKNPWDFSRRENIIRRKNLEGYFTAMEKLKPSILLVGEAPGYRGCGRVGMPFSSEKLILSHPFFADKNTFTIEHEDAPIAEASASIVWKTFDSLNFYPLMWATYPFHPHKFGDVLSNRAPRLDEILLGKEFLQDIIQIFKITQLIAVGRVAEKCLSDMGYKAYAVRHPSHGGATLFAEGLKKYVKDNKIVVQEVSK
jgi:hypothetical protein